MSKEMKPTLRDYERLAGALYQAAGCYDLPERFLDVLSCAQRREPFRHLLDGLLPCFESELPDANRYRFIRERISVTELQLILGRKPDPEPAYEVEIDAVVDAAMRK